MRWYRDNWFWFGGVLFIIEAAILLIWGGEMDMLLIFMILSVMALHIHQFEEYAIPGGFPVFNNVAFLGEKEIPDRYPLSRKGAFVCNVCCMYPVYALGLIFHQHIWVVLCIMLFGVTQFLVHGIVINKKAGTIYNPGLASVVVLFIPLCIAYIMYIYSNFTVGLLDWVLAVVFIPVVGFVCLLLPMNKTSDRDAPDEDAWSEEDMQKFGIMEKLLGSKS